MSRGGGGVYSVGVYCLRWCAVCSLLALVKIGCACRMQECGIYGAWPEADTSV